MRKQFKLHEALVTCPLTLSTRLLMLWSERSEKSHGTNRHETGPEFGPN
jgi:hypothetical protein